jgi:hypothetical protein
MFKFSDASAFNSDLAGWNATPGPWKPLPVQVRVRPGSKLGFILGRSLSR